jgi:hypothetical protein
MRTLPRFLPFIRLRLLYQHVVQIKENYDRERALLDENLRVTTAAARADLETQLKDKMDVVMARQKKLSAQVRFEKLFCCDGAVALTLGHVCSDPFLVGA